MGGSVWTDVLSVPGGDVDKAEALRDALFSLGYVNEWEEGHLRVKLRRRGHGKCLVVVQVSAFPQGFDTVEKLLERVAK